MNMNDDPDIEQHPRPFGNPFQEARLNLDGRGVTEATQEWALAIAALLENHPYGSQDVVLSDLPVSDLPGFNPPWERTVRELWVQPPGLRDEAWKKRGPDFHQQQRDAIEAARVYFRNSVALCPWVLPSK
jgi:hypothetical protein